MLSAISSRFVNICSLCPVSKWMKLRLHILCALHQFVEIFRGCCCCCSSAAAILRVNSRCSSSAGRVFWVSAWGLFWKICRLCRVLSEASHSLHVTYMIKASCEWCRKCPVLNGMVGSIDTVLHRIPAKASLTVGPSIISTSHLHPGASYTQGETTVRKHTGLENNICTFC